MVETNPRRNPLDYWTALKDSLHRPNSWMTKEYVSQAGIVWLGDPHLCGWIWADEDSWVFPPLSPQGFVTQGVPIWAGFMTEEPAGGHEMELDRQYIYDAHEFLDLTGSRWSTFRKNVRKYPERSNKPLLYERLNPMWYSKEVDDLLLTWATGRVLFDHETMTNLVLHGMERWGLFNGGELVGLNVGDRTSSHAVYRYCIDNGTPFLNEYLRYRFYTSGWVQSCRWVNDGGDFDNESLARFKRKLNPAKIYRVYSSVPIR